MRWAILLQLIINSVIISGLRKKLISTYPTLYPVVLLDPGISRFLLYDCRKYTNAVCSCCSVVDLPLCLSMTSKIGNCR